VDNGGHPYTQPLSRSGGGRADSVGGPVRIVDADEEARELAAWAQRHDDGGPAAVDRHEILASAPAPGAQRENTGQAGPRGPHPVQLPKRPRRDPDLGDLAKRRRHVTPQRAKPFRLAEHDLDPSARDLKLCHGSTLNP